MDEDLLNDRVESEMVVFCQRLTKRCSEEEKDDINKYLNTVLTALEIGSKPSDPPSHLHFSVQTLMHNLREKAVDIYNALRGIPSTVTQNAIRSQPSATHPTLIAEAYPILLQQQAVSVEVAHPANDNNNPSIEGLDTDGTTPMQTTDTDGTTPMQTTDTDGTSPSSLPIHVQHQQPALETIAPDQPQTGPGSTQASRFLAFKNGLKGRIQPEASPQALAMQVRSMHHMTDKSGPSFDIKENILCSPYEKPLPTKATNPSGPTTANTLHLASKNNVTSGPAAASAPPTPFVQVPPAQYIPFKHEHRGGRSNRHQAPTMQAQQQPSERSIYFSLKDQHSVPSAVANELKLLGNSASVLAARYKNDIKTATNEQLLARYKLEVGRGEFKQLGSGRYAPRNMTPATAIPHTRPPQIRSFVATPGQNNRWTGFNLANNTSPPLGAPSYANDNANHSGAVAAEGEKRDERNGSGEL